MPIKSNNPATVNKTFDEWFLRAFSITPNHEGPWTAQIKFWRARQTGQTLTDDDGQSLLDHHGVERPAYELQREDVDGFTRVVDYPVPDVQAMARQLAEQGDTRLRDAIDDIIAVVTEQAFAEGVID